MGRTHSNAYHKAKHFFDIPYDPVLQIFCGLVEEEAKAFAKKWEYKSYVTD